jgi:hypothetical protein
LVEQAAFMLARVFLNVLDALFHDRATNTQEPVEPFQFSPAELVD